MTKTKNRYQQMLFTYEGRREALKEKLGRGHPDYARRSIRIKARIDHCRRMIGKITVREAKIRKMAWKICEFMDISLLRGAQPLRNSVASRTPKLIRARMLLYKYGIENGITGAHLSYWVGSKRSSTAPRGRRTFTRSFMIKPENKALWNHFKLYLNSLNSEVVLKKSVAA
jgi:hypothetical protein